MRMTKQHTLALLLLLAGSARAKDGLVDVVDTPLFVVLPATTLPEVVSSAGRATKTRGTAICAALSVRANGDNLDLEFVDTNTFRASLFHGVDGGASLVKGWFVENATHDRVPALCEQAFSTRSFSTAATSPIETSAGPIFRDETACRRHAGASYDSSCVSGVCMSSPLSAPLFSLGDCAPVLREASRRLQAVGAVDDTKRLAATKRALALWRSGGEFFDSVTDGVCRRWTLKAVKTGEGNKADARAITTHVDDAGTTTVDLSLWTTKKLAVEHSRRHQLGLGSRGGSGAQRNLAFGDDRFFLDGVPHFFSAQACAAAR